VHAQGSTLHLVTRDGSKVDVLGAAPTSPRRVRIIDGTLACLARHGTTKTTVDDIARESGVSRATVYRVFPGGRDQILSAVVDTEMARLFSALGVRLGKAHTLTEALVGGIVEASSRIGNHAALAYLVAHEPELILAHLAFDESDRLLTTASQFTAPFLARWMSPAEAERVAEWATRIVLSYAIAPSPGMDLTDPVDAERLVTTFVTPGIEALHRSASPGPIVITPFATTGPPEPAPMADRTRPTYQSQHANPSMNTEHDKGDRP
jgi:AcrR family transcriptional regulator